MSWQDLCGLLFAKFRYPSKLFSTSKLRKRLFFTSVKPNDRIEMCKQSQAKTFFLPKDCCNIISERASFNVTLCLLAGFIMTPLISRS